MEKHIQTLFGPSPEGYEPPPEPEPGDAAWHKLGWVLYPLILLAVFTHGALSGITSKVFWTLFVMGLLVTSEWAGLKKSRTQISIVVAAALHLALMTFTYDLLPEHRRLLVIIFISVGEAIVFGVPIRLLSLRDAQ